MFNKALKEEIIALQQRLEYESNYRRELDRELNKKLSAIMDYLRVEFKYVPAHSEVALKKAKEDPFED